MKFLSNKKNVEFNKRAFYAPSWLDDVAKNEWRRIIKIIDLDTFTEADLKTLEIYCISYSKWRTAEEVIIKEGLTFETPNGYVQQRPQVSIASQALKDMQSTAKELGLTSASRVKINKERNVTDSVAGEDTDDELEDLIS